jgi:hypothetical protein
VPYGRRFLIERRRDAVLTIRFITAGAVLVVAVGGAAAQSATGETAGKPVSLLQVLTQPATITTTTTTVTTTTEAKPHIHYTHRRAARHFVKKSHERAADEAAADTDEPVQGSANTSAPAPAAAPAVTTNTWATDAAPLPGVATDATAPTVIPAIDQNLSEIVVGGRTVQIATPDEANAIDLAADHQTAPQAAVDTPIASAATPAVALAEPDDQNQKRDAWYEELLATLGGALAAGLVAWFLIMGGGPQPRMYG